MSSRPPLHLHRQEAKDQKGDRGELEHLQVKSTIGCKNGFLKNPVILAKKKKIISDVCSDGFMHVTIILMMTFKAK